MSKYIYNKVQAIKKKEQDVLKQTLLNYGKEEEGQRIYRFSDDTAPIVAGYLFDDPCDIVIKKVAIDEDGSNLEIIGEDKEARGQELVVNPDDIFAGHIDFITDEIIWIKK